MATIISKSEGKRGCGFRDSGGKYFVSEGEGRECGMFPIPITACPFCGQAIKQTRNFQWISGKIFTEQMQCLSSPNDCTFCPALQLAQMEKIGLMWVGKRYYPTPESFMDEARSMGVSKKISNIPKDFRVGVDWILLAHPLASPAISDNPDEIGKSFAPGIFYMFRPTAVEYIYKGNELESELDELEAKGYTIVDLKHEKSNQQKLFDVETPVDPQGFAELMAEEIIRAKITFIAEKHPGLLAFIQERLEQKVSPASIYKELRGTYPASLLASIQQVAEYMKKRL